MGRKGNGADGADAGLSQAKSTDKEQEGAEAATPAAKASSEKPQITPEMKAKLAALRERVQLSVGQAVLAMGNLPRYRSQTLGDLQHLVIEPLLRDRLAVAHARSPSGEAGEGEAGDAAPAGQEATAGIAIWASVSDEVAAKIRDQIKGGVFPTRLSADDWTSGENIWLLDLIAPNRQLATAVLANFKQIAGDKPVSIHPIVARSVDPQVLEKMRAKGE
ncbi:toxin-activating lysine-acyltransferase [Alteraurantiacibacter aquimixticola]|uniref:RTX toxin-activating lysine-acyltransferase n=1 Tax=Alteraurantiacibacter aquimixticola TaxID=2489173 RepID=A0A4T3F1Q8_9SPHN|nr:toxin-activating lysine-acyltransferase [Alteraurantiacibacter aquimixticola]TIX51145.1 toxin-activating lysine-acyltransferase [Alteraurantiacibacter aquimixticola]